MNEQQSFWAKEYAQDYIAKNSSFDHHLGVTCWKTMLTKANNIRSLLECGCNVGRNIAFLESVVPDATKSIIEISKPAFDFVNENFTLEKSFHGSIVESDFQDTFDLVFTMGVMIHIAPDDLIPNMTKMYNYSKRYILFGEYFNRTPVMIEYQGRTNKLFKRDFGKLFAENFQVTIVDNGFLWGHLYDNAGFDDITPNYSRDCFLMKQPLWSHFELC
jgi:pseudaminic acid biosynthesis-associated methylase